MMFNLLDYPLGMGCHYGLGGARCVVSRCSRREFFCVFIEPGLGIIVGREHLVGRMCNREVPCRVSSSLVVRLF